MSLTATPPTPPLSELEAYVTDTMNLLSPSSAAIVVSRGEEVIFENYISGSFEGLPSTEVNSATLWPLASVTKSVSAGVLLALVRQDIVYLDDPVSKYLPHFENPGTGPFSRRDVTVRHLASHTSGLQFPGKQPQGSFYDLETATEPGTTFNYSAIGMAVLQKVIESATVESYESIAQREILGPLNLTGMRYLHDYDPTLPLIATYAGEFDDPAQHYFLTPTDGFVGSGLYSTARDLNRYGQLWATGGTLGDRTYFTPELQNEAVQAQSHFDYLNADYGLLSWVFPEKRAMVMSGATHTVNAISLEHGTVVTVMRNYYGDIPDGFTFHTDKKRLVEFARLIGAATTTP